MPESRQTIERRWKAFVGEYIKDFNAQRAYEDCGCYKARGKSAQVSAFNLLSNDKIQALIRDAIDKRNARLELDQDRIVLEQLRLAISDMRNYMTWDDSGVRLKNSTELTDSEAAAISEITQTVTERGVTVRFKLHNKTTSLDSLFRHLGLYEADNRRSIDFGVAEVPAENHDSWDAAVRQEMNHAATNGKAQRHLEG